MLDIYSGLKMDCRQSNTKRDAKSSFSLFRNITAAKNSLRCIIIDGSNVARTHGNRSEFSSRGIKFAVDHFLKLGHTNVVAMVPQYRRRALNHKYPTLEHELLDEMENNNNLVYTPSEAYDDRFIIKAAVHHNALIVSNDKYRDLMQEDKEWDDFIKKNRIGLAFVGDFFQIPDDPMGRKGPKLQELLSNSPKCHINDNTEKLIVKYFLIFVITIHLIFLPFFILFYFLDTR